MGVRQLWGLYRLEQLLSGIPPFPKTACRRNSEQIELKSFQLLCFAILLSSTASKDFPSVVGWTPVSRTILVAVSVLPYRRWFASLSGSTVAPPRDTPANSPSALPQVRISASDALAPVAPGPAAAL